jgi:DNA repair exonuclease SbcCD ATPase subunit
LSKELSNLDPSKTELYTTVLNDLKLFLEKEKGITIEMFLTRVQESIILGKKIETNNGKIELLKAYHSELEEKIKKNVIITEYFNQIINPIKACFKAKLIEIIVEKFVWYLVDEVNWLLNLTKLYDDEQPILEFRFTKENDGSGKKAVFFMAKPNRGRVQSSFIPISQLSSGERALLSLAISCALYRIIGVQIPFLFLDEPTQCLDHENIRRLARFINNLQQSGVNQIFIITHNKELLDDLVDVHVLDLSK